MTEQFCAAARILRGMDQKAGAEVPDSPGAAETGGASPGTVGTGSADPMDRLIELQRELMRLRGEEPESVIKRLQKEMALAGEDKPPKSPGLDAKQRPHELRAERRAVWKSTDVARAWASEVTDDQAAKVLQAVRDRAEGWRSGTAAVLALITATLVLGGDTFDAINEAGAVKPAIVVLIAVAAVLALVSLYFTLRAAHGPAFLDTKIRETIVEAALVRDMRRAGAAAADLKLAQWLLGAAVVAFLTALVIMWWVE